MLLGYNAGALLSLGAQVGAAHPRDAQRGRLHWPSTELALN
jgi:hypothetical protein